jgi:hypothetical protein
VSEHENGIAEAQPTNYDWIAIGKALENTVDVITDVFHKMSENVLKPLYDHCLLVASAENQKWYYYYKNAKRRRTREKYRILLQNTFLSMVAANKGNDRNNG